MRLAILSDVHANHPALLNVLKDIRKRRVDKTFCLGDIVGYGPHPNQVIETLRECRVPTVMGNYDEGVGFEKGDCGCAYINEIEKRNGQVSIDWTTVNVADENKEYLRSLPRKIRTESEGVGILFVHGSPRRINEYLYGDRPDKSLRRALNDAIEDVIVCGHTHIPYHRILDGRHVVNVGSVGKPKDGDPRACYAVIEFGKQVRVMFHRVDYPVEKVAEKVRQVGLPEAYAEALLTGGK